MFLFLFPLCPSSGPLIPGWVWIPGQGAAVASRLPRARQKLPQPPAALFSSCPPRAHFSASVLSTSPCGLCFALSASAPQLVPSSPFLSLCPLSPGSPDPPSAASSHPTFCSVAPRLLHSVLHRFPSSWCARSSPKAAPLDASPCQASWAPSPPSPCTDTAQTRAVSGAAPRGHMAHPGLSTLPGPLSSEALLSRPRPRPRPRPRRGEELKGAAPP